MLKENLKPTAKIAVSKNVLKHYKFSNEDVVYLSDGTDFQIELYNPTLGIILAKIEINGKSDDNGLVLYPAQRVFLERSFTNNHKFRFITYNVEENQESKEVIKNNGLITIKFYKEQLERSIYTTTPCSFPPLDNWFQQKWISPTVLFPSQVFYGTCQDSIVDAPSYEVNANLETGIITKGEISKQEFINTNEKFESMYFEKIDIRILPQSQQPVSSNDIKHRRYCSECGTKLREKDKYCFNCGSKI